MNLKEGDLEGGDLKEDSLNKQSLEKESLKEQSFEERDLKENYFKKGLSKKEAEENLKKYGSNEIKDSKKFSIIKILLRQIKSNFVIYLLVFATIISFFVGKDLTAYVILGVILLVIFTGFIQEYKAEKAISALKKMITPHSLVVRDGIEQDILSKEIVPKDIIILHTGERVPADCVIIEEKDLVINESILTGESQEVKKLRMENWDSFKEIKDENILFMGSFIVNGKCKARVIKTGMNTRFGKIAGMISKSEKELPLQKKVNKISKYMAIAGLSMAIIIGLIMILREQSLNKDVIMAVLITVIAVAVSSFPEGFPVVLITSLASGSYQMAKRNAIVNRMSIIETLGETTIICSDKTGTITKGEMTVKEIFTNNKNYEVAGTGYDSNGKFNLNGKEIDIKKEPNLNLIFNASVLCNESKIFREENDYDSTDFHVTGMPTEAALLIMAAKAGIFKEKIGYSVLDEIPFSSERKMMSVLINQKDEKKVYVKGALEILLKKCTHIQKKYGVFRIQEKDKNKILEEGKRMTSKSLRIISFAYREGKDIKNKEDMESNLIFLGFVGIEDPPREEIREAIETCRKAGIKVKMVTGDNKETALSIAKQIELDDGKVLEGEELDKITDKDLIKIVKDVVVFARVRPEHKLRIVKALKERGEIVTMTGDGVNDSPALKEAHIGVAMGRNGTDVSRSVADLTLKDDNFATIVDAIKEGRKIFSNIQKFSTYQISVNFSQVMLIFLAIVLGMPLPLIAIQILFMNLFSDELTALTLAFNPYSKDIMDTKPRRKSEIITKPLFIMLIVAGIVMSVGSLLIFYYTHNILNKPEETARTITFVAMVLFGITNAYNFRSFRKPTIGRSLLVNKPLLYASVFAIIGTAVIVYSPLNSAFEAVPIPFIYWIITFLISLSVVILFDFLKYLNNKKQIWSEDLQELNLKSNKNKMNMNQTIRMIRDL